MTGQMGGQHPQNVSLQQQVSSLQQRPKTNRQDEEGDNGTLSNSTSQSGTA